MKLDFLQRMQDRIMLAQPDTGSSTFPATANEVYEMVETLATQSITRAKSGNPLREYIPMEDIGNGMVKEEAVIEMAKDYAYDKDALPFVEGDKFDPTVLVQYFHKYEERQFATRVRYDEIRKVLMKARTPESVVAEIIGSLTEAEGYYDLQRTLEIFTKGAFVNYATIGGTALDMDGVLMLVRDAYNHMIETNSDASAIKYATRTDPADIRIFMPVSVMNVLDVTKLANLFNLSKVDLMGRIVPLPDTIYEVANADSATQANAMKLRYTIFVADIKALICARRVYDYTQDYNGKAKYTNHYLTTETMYGFCKLFKAVKIETDQAVAATLSGHITPASVALQNLIKSVKMPASNEGK